MAETAREHRLTGFQRERQLTQFFVGHGHVDCPRVSPSVPPWRTERTDFACQTSGGSGGESAEVVLGDDGYRHPSR